MSEDIKEDAPFTFDFAITEQAKDWQELDANVQVPTEKKVKHSDQSFFANIPAGNEYFTIDDPVAVKRKWLEDRKLVKDAVRQTGKHFLWNSKPSQKQ